MKYKNLMSKILRQLISDHRYNFRFRGLVSRGCDHTIFINPFSRPDIISRTKVRSDDVLTGYLIMPFIDTGDFPSFGHTKGTGVEYWTGDLYLQIDAH